MFEAARPRLFGIAYRMLGSAADAEDLVQDAFVRWQTADQSTVRTPEAWLVTVVTRLAIDRLRRTALERAAYPGQWLPEPIATDAPSIPDRHVEAESDLSLAFLLLLERLAPEERAAFVLREVFDAEYDEIAQVLEKTEAASRQIVHRARVRVRADRARFQVATEAKQRLVERFLAALAASDKEAMLAVVAEDVTFTADGGGKAAAIRNVIHGADPILRLLFGFQEKGRGIVQHELTWLNGEPAIATYVKDQIFFTTSFTTDGERVLAIYRTLNPDKLRHAGRPHPS